MAAKQDAGSESPTSFDESWIVIDDMPDERELDESVLNPVSARARTVSNLVQKMRRLKPKRSTNSGDDQAAQRSQGETEGRPQASGNDNRGGVINVFRRFRSRSSTFAGGGEKQQEAQGERLATMVSLIPRLSHGGEKRACVRMCQLLPTNMVAKPFFTRKRYCHRLVMVSYKVSQAYVDFDPSNHHFIVAQDQQLSSLAAIVYAVT